MRATQPFLIIFLLTLFPVLRGQAAKHDAIQEQYERFNKLYGLDHQLVNGLEYMAEFPGTKGHPFLNEEHFTSGSIQIGEVWYRDVMLAYDIHNQEVVLNYKNSYGGSEFIVLHNEFIKGFWLGSRKFKKLDLLLKGEEFFQVLEVASLKCYSQWSKGINETVHPFVYWTPDRKFYLLKDEQVHPFNSKRAFIKLFAKEYRVSIKKHFKKARIKLNSISDGELMELLAYCEKLDE